MEEINEMYREQFDRWPQCKDNYDALLKAERRTIVMGDLPVMVQCNPARARSTEAKVDAASIAERPCFLCAKNRPKEQLAGQAIPDFEILINPYPILPVHFTVVSKEHQRQDAMPLEMVNFVDMTPQAVAFFNGAKAGASAPDHLHFQAVLKEELPLLSAVERLHRHSDGTVKLSTELGDFPMSFLSVIIPLSFEGMLMLAELPKFGGLPDDPEANPRDFVNTLVWMDNGDPERDDAPKMRALVIPRRRHRPDCYFAQGEDKLAVSPGALDMAGLIVTPHREDFDRITAGDIAEIYRQTGLSAAELPEWYEGYPDFIKYTGR